MTNVTFPLLIQRGCSIDAHLKVVVATIDGVGIHKETCTFNTFTSCLTEMKEMPYFTVVLIGIMSAILSSV